MIGRLTPGTGRKRKREEFKKEKKEQSGEGTRRYLQGLPYPKAAFRELPPLLERKRRRKLKRGERREEGGRKKKARLLGIWDDL